MSRWSLGVWVFWFALAVLVLVGGFWAVFGLVWWFLPGEGVWVWPAGLVSGLLSGGVRVSAGFWAVFGLVLVVLAGVVAGVVWWLRGWWVSGRVRGDEAARHTRPGDVSGLSLPVVSGKAARLGVVGVDGRVVSGLPVGRAVSGGGWLLASWEDVQVDIWGPRTGKTTSRAIPLILSGPGCCVVTSNKPDVLFPGLGVAGVFGDLRDGIRRVRPGSDVVVFDPQGITGVGQSWWWDPLSTVTDSVSASELAGVFADAARGSGGGGKDFWELKARGLLSCLLLAAAKGPDVGVGVDIRACHRWAGDESDEDPVMILERAGEVEAAYMLRGIQATTPVTRSGVYANAQQMVEFLVNRSANRWITAQPGCREFDPVSFVRGSDTVYLFSQEGAGCASAVMTALMVAVTEAALRFSRECGGRLPSPMVVVLDEAANVCRWSELPAKYSFYGSNGICVDTILQSWSQGVDAWGESGMRKLWSAANVRVYGGGVAEEKFLSELSGLIGDFWADTETVSVSAGSSSRTKGIGAQARRIAPVADLAALPPGRAWCFSSGSKPVLLEPEPWYKGPHAASIQPKTSP